MIRLHATVLALALAGGLAAPRSAGAQATPYEVTNFRIVPSGEATQIVIETTGNVRYRDEFQRFRRI